MRHVLAAALILTAAMPALAELKPGAAAPTFTAQGAVAGQAFNVDLKAALKKGPVVLYFFPAAFTPGCNAEAHAFAEAIDAFKAQGATVIGMTAGNTDQIAKFSSAYCAGKFPVAAATPAVAAGYDVALKRPDGSASGYTSRTSYVITPDDRIYFVYSDANAAEHVAKTLDAVKRYRATRR
jgi:thioredoxin-dependent peroxiredoxin